MREPTGDECTENLYLADVDGYACWYPQQGGYVGKCVIVFDDNGAELGARNNAAMIPGGCFTAYVWHDGEFPTPGEPPVGTHHCSSNQFIEFGNQVRDFEISRQRARR